MWDFYASGAPQLWMWFAGAFVLGGALLYGVIRAGRIRGRERATLDRNTRAQQVKEDPQR